MDEKYILRVQTKSGVLVIDDLMPSSLLSELQRRISTILQVPISSFEVLSGYPPRPLTDGNISLAESGVHSGEVLHTQPRRKEGGRRIFPGPQAPEPLSYGDNESPSDQGYLHFANFGDYAGPPNPRGTMMRVEMPADNSCLFTSVHFLVTGRRRIEPENARVLRILIAQCVAQDPIRYSDAFLGMPNADYCNWIQNPDNWGGAIELSILSDHYGIEIVTVDIRSLTMLIFGENRNYGNRIYLIYDGIHYEPLILDTGEPRRLHLFSVHDDYAESSAREVAQEARASHQFVDVANFRLKCLICETCLRGEREAREHTKNTGHNQFGEIRNEEP